ncbi:dipeptide/oligopeptide/nickel ABC transporter permease/ATP-binding protein [Actinomadura sp. DC4]|uniref:dipeptide/oligopeptide/nickel ABC transporter permease/ATP-binding protein n=1 Tax=Actinomadura sp. DC4 TaxID=3055069 RepID=UPI0025AFDD7A|nr:dipeptide/oligopeptide/nickel ABC transporter permease/ATP-binding protein [Actinomadura sp. DC4]MDN3353641.1 dipeptide/oligopeptide/nickel ABC transporter permease/ATP-binding protein [Actinomadura sp. DC4]
MRLRTPHIRRPRGPLAVITTVLLAVLLLVAVAGPSLFGHRAGSIDVNAIQRGMSGRHLFGTDALGRDILARTVVATRKSLWLALLATLLGTLCGVVAGSLPVVVGRRLGRLIVAAFNLLVAFPGLLLALFLALVFGVGARGAVLSLAVGMAPSFARLTHTTASSVARADYVSAARLLNVPRHRLLTRHVLPNIAEPLLVNATSQVGASLLSLSALSYLGFGVQPPAYDWGRMLSDGLPSIYTNPSAALAPCVAIVLAGVTFVLAGELLTQLVAGAGHAPVRRVEAATGAASGEAPDTGEHVLRVEDLTVTFPGTDGPVTPVDGVSLSVRSGEIVGLVGESGSGKSLTALAIGSLVSHPGVARAGTHTLSGNDLAGMRPAARERFLGNALAMVFQDPMSALNPAIRVGRQLAEVSEVHQGLSRTAAMGRAVDRLRSVRIPEPERRARQYPMEFSGGMRQRAAIGIGLMTEPVLIVADEPTTALDVTVQRDVLTLLRQVRDERDAAVLLISHDIAVIAEIASRVLVMYGGRVVEDLPVGALADDAAHPYTRALVASVPDMTTDRERPLATIPGRPPDPAARPAGCAFAPRCAYADETCRTTVPPLAGTGDGRKVACWHPVQRAEPTTEGH